MSLREFPHGRLHRLLSDHSFALVASHELERMPAGAPSWSTAVGDLRDSADLLPRLFDLRALEPHFSDDLLQTCLAPAAYPQDPAFAVLIDAAEDGAAVAAHLGRVQLARSKGGERAWLRIHDPRVWLQLHRILGEGMLSSILGPIVRWTFLWGGRWYSQDHFVPGPQPVGPMYLDTPTWNAIARVGVVNRALVESGYATADPEGVLRTSQIADELVQRAQAVHGLCQIDEQVRFCGLGLRVHPRFDEHPLVRGLLAAPSESSSDQAVSGSKIDPLTNKDEAFWLHVRQALSDSGKEST